MRSLQRVISGERPLPLATQVAVAVAAVALATVLLYPLKEAAPVLSLGVVYLLATVVVALIGGLFLALATAVACALAFNFFHIPPVGRFAIAEPENVVALVAFLIAAALASSVAELARARARDAQARRREADLSADLARILLSGGRLEHATGAAAHRLAQVLDLPWASIELGPPPPGDERRRPLELRAGTRYLGTLIVPADLPAPQLRRAQDRVIPSLEALLDAAVERRDLGREVVETEALRRSDVLKTAILRAVSHDLRSPLTAIATAVEGLRVVDRPSAERAELVDVVSSESDRLTRMIDNLLDLSRLESGAAEPRRAEVHLDEVIRTAVVDVHAAPDAFSLSLDPSMPALSADPSQLERAFANLLENAVRHSDGHPVSVRAAEVNKRLYVRIVDRGPGIPPAQQERVFEPFYRAGNERTGHRGSGLGLAIARGFVEANGGQVWVESLPGQGTTFAVRFTPA